MAIKHVKVGEPVVFRLSKLSSHPGPRAQSIKPAPRGEQYWYEVDKFWVVSEARPSGELVLKTRRGKTHVLPSDHAKLRRPRLWEKLLYRHKLPSLDQALAAERERQARTSDSDEGPAPPERQDGAKPGVTEAGEVEDSQVNSAPRR